MEEFSNIKESFNGYFVNLVDAIPDFYCCPFCKLILREPIQTYRGERACIKCYFNAKSLNPSVCPIDLELISEDEVFPDIFFGKQIGRIKCYCNNSDIGCNWEGEIKQLENHSQKCEFNRTICSLCGENMSFKDYELHKNCHCLLTIKLPNDVEPHSDLLMRATQTLKKSHEDIKQKIEDQNAKLSQIFQLTLDYQKAYGHTKKVVKLYKKFNEEITKFDGNLIWKINNIHYRSKQAEQGKIVALHSAPCFTSQNGYKFCARLYLNGDGDGLNTHVSLFFVLMRSELDALLEWPFKKRVKLQLINVVDQERSHEETFLPDVVSPSFQRPKSEINIAAGCPMFLEKEKLQTGFIVDDCLFVQITVAP